MYEFKSVNNVLLAKMGNGGKMNYNWELEKAVTGSFLPMSDGPHTK